MSADRQRLVLVAASIGLHLAAAALLLARPAWWPWLLLAVAANHGVLLALVLSPQSQAIGRAIVRLPASAAARGEVALTFDDGPDPEVTPQVLALLAAAGATASFFCIGARAKRRPALVQAIIRGGHSVENHTLNHVYGFACLTPAGLRREVNGGQALLTAVAGRPPRFFRAPMGFRSPLLDPVLARAGLAAVSWSRRGYDTVRRRPEAVLRSLARGLKAGDVLVLHDGNAARSADRAPMVLAVLPGLLAALETRGLKGVSLPVAYAAEEAECEAASPAPAAYAST